MSGPLRLTLRLGGAVGACLLAGWMSCSALQAADAKMVAARQKFFGVENVDPHSGRVAEDKVVLSWLSNSSLAAAIAGRVILLDTYITRLEVTPGRTPLVIGDLVDLAPEAILLGHGHFDHADNAAYLAAKTGATIYASEETCAAMQADFAREATDAAIQGNAATAFPRGAALSCKPVTSAGSVPGTQVVRLNFLEPEACVIAFRHLHSIAVPPDPTWPRAPTPSVYYAADPRDATLFPAGTPLAPGKSGALSGQMNIATSGNSGPGGPVALFFDVVLRKGRHFTLVWYNSAGALKEGRGSGWTTGTPADGQRLVNLMQSLPPTDVDLGTIATSDFDNNTYRDPFAYVQALKPKIFIPMHLTTGTTFKESVSLAVYGGYLDQIKRLGLTLDQWPTTRWLVDPADYAKPMVYDIDDPQWHDPNKEARTAQFCGSDRHDRDDDDRR
ncbi:L-ascorbate metabolism protein UlaG (beta-lactamase superfamily) [Bradyrhizobium sp. USDA 4369]